MAHGQLKGQYAMVEASVKAAYARAEARSSYSKSLYARARWLERKCVINTVNTFAVSPVFSHLLEVGFKTIPNGDQYDYFLQLFELFGQVYPTSVTIGGQLETEREIISKETHYKIKSTLDAEMFAAINGKTASGSVSLGINAATGKEITNADYRESYRYTAVGGDEGKKSEPHEWLPWVNNTDMWRDIELGGLVEIQKLFSAAEKKLFDEMLKRTQEASWPVVGPVANPQWPARQVRPYFPMESGVTLRSMYATPAGQTPSDRYDWDRAGDYLKAANGGLDPRQMDQNPHDVQNGVQSADASGTRLTWPSQPARASGETYQAYAPAPLRAPRADGGNAQQSNLLWRFAFSGELLDGEPLLYLYTEEGDTRMVLCGFDAGPVKFASLLPMQYGLFAGTASTKWVLRPSGALRPRETPPAAVSEQPPAQKGMVQTV